MRGLWGSFVHEGQRKPRSKHGRKPIEECPKRNRRNGASFFWSEKEGKERPQKKGKRRKQRGLLVEQKQGHRGDERERARKQKAMGRGLEASKAERAPPPVRVLDGVSGAFRRQKLLISSVSGDGTGSLSITKSQEKERGAEEHKGRRSWRGGDGKKERKKKKKSEGAQTTLNH